MYRRLFLALYLALILWGTGLQRLDACYVTLPEDDRPMLTMSSAERLALMKYHGVGSLKITRFQVFIKQKGKWLAVNPRPGRMAKNVRPEKF